MIEARHLSAPALQPEMYEHAATKILKWYLLAERDLLGSVIVTFLGEAGVVRELRLDDAHGLCFTIDDPPRTGPSYQRWYPVSTIRRCGRK